SRRGVRTDLVGAKCERLLAIGRVEVGVVGLEAISLRVFTVVGATRRALPFVFGAKTRMWNAAGMVEPCHVCDRVVPGDGRGGHSQPILVATDLAGGIDNLFAGARRVRFGRGLQCELPGSVSELLQLDVAVIETINRRNMLLPLLRGQSAQELDPLGEGG